MDLINRIGKVGNTGNVMGILIGVLLGILGMRILEGLWSTGRIRCDGMGGMYWK